MVKLTIIPVCPVDVGLSPQLSLSLSPSRSSSLALPLSPATLYLQLIADAGSIAAAIDLCVETPSRQEK